MSSVAGLSQFVKKIDVATKDLKHFDEDAEFAIAHAMKMAVTPLMSGASGGDLRLSGYGGSRTREQGGRRIGVQYKKAKGAGVLFSAYGPAHILERGTSKHAVGIGRSKKAADVIIMKMPDGNWATGPFFAGGSPASHPFERGVAIVRPNVERIAGAKVTKSMRKAFGG